MSLVTGGVAAAVFVPPSRSERESAAGSLLSLEPPLRQAFMDHGEFQAKKEPGGLDWLATHEEPGQTFNEYLGSRPNVPNAGRGKLYILPIGGFEKGIAPDLAKLKDYTAAYYHPMPVEMLPVLADAEVPAKGRINGMSGKKQWKSTDLLRWLPGKLPKDGYAMIAVTMTDLYPDENWNFVFGQASTRNRVGVFSFARYHPAWTGGVGDAGTEALVLRRAAKVLTHEMGHMFGIRHCIYYECNMNGANHLVEADSTPMHLCPVCLRKLHHAIRFDPLGRYAGLGKFYRANEMNQEEAWVADRVRKCQVIPDP
ncbi:archaemetzincin [Luteolibacter marinus]|uniref:archaemetzincin n=1 Tax=Luteolibacter marinus TaxID=2776705 RepID=UPI001865C76B|nr:archaemetzincin [Luteolibacter marinus]